jgi:hypothetical protein
LGAWSTRPCVVVPPRDPLDPVTVYLRATGRHAGLLLPGEDGLTIEYDYGDWGWYALARDEWWRAPATVLWPTPGTLGRREIRAADLVAMKEASASATLAELRVPRAAVRRLRARLDDQFFAGGDPHHQTRYGMDFVNHPRGFWMFHNCHDEVASWLEELGCRVGWAPIRVALRIGSPE